MFDALHRAPLPFGLLVPRRGVASGRARQHGRRAGSRGARAHRPRWAARRDGDGAGAHRSRDPADHGRRDHARRRPPPDSSLRGRARLPKPLPAPHEGIREGPSPAQPSVGRDREPHGRPRLPDRLRTRRDAREADRSGAGTPRPRSRAQRLAETLRPRQPACRAAAPLRPPRPPPQPPARPARRPARRPHRRHRQRPCTRARARGTPGRVRRGQARHDARRVRAAPARQPLALPRAAGCDGGALSRHAGGGARVGPAGGPASLRPHPGPRLPLPGLGGPGCRSQARAAVRRADRRALRGPRQPRRGARPARARSFA